MLLLGINIYLIDWNQVLQNTAALAVLAGLAWYFIWGRD